MTDVYDFTIAADHGSRLWLNGVLVGDDWNPADGENGGWHTVSVRLTGGEPVVALLDYYQAWGGASAALYWSGSQQPWALLGGSAVKALTANQAPWLKPFLFQNNKTGERVDLPLFAPDAEGDPITFSVSGLPPGVNILATAVPGSNPRGISPVTSVSLSGRPTRSGIYPVTVTATTPDGAHVESSFTWTVRGPAIAALGEVQELLQCSLTIFPAGSGFQVSYTVPAGIGNYYGTRLQTSTDLREWEDTTSATRTKVSPNGDTLYSLQWHSKLGGESPRRFFRPAIDVRP